MGRQVELAWQLLKKSPYSQGYARKAFRAPDDPQATLAYRCTWLECLLSLIGTYQLDIVTAPWLAAWAPHVDNRYGVGQDTIGRLLAAVIDGGGAEADEVFDILAQSARNEHDIGGMGRHVSRALLLASRAEGWELMEKMLLAAQRQEGLRQAILETVDEAHPEAFRRMLRLIIEHDLARFSAVVRAVNVWFGLLWDSVSVKTINDTIAKALRFLDDAEARKRALEGKNAEDVFLALWSIAFEDAPAAIPVAARLLKHPSVEHRYVAALHLMQLGLKQAQAARCAALDDEDLRVACCALTGAVLSEGEPDELTEGSDLFERLERLYQRMPEKPVQPKPLVWPWNLTRVDRRDVTARMIGALGKRPPTRLLPYLAAFNPWTRRQVVELLAAQKKWDRMTRDSLLDLAGDTSSDVRQAVFTALAKGSLQREEAERLEGYLTRKTSDLRRGAIGLLAQQKDADALGSADRLLTAKDANQRLAGLELLRQLAEAGRQLAACQERARSYQATRKQPSKEEQTQLAAISEAGREKITLDNALGLLNPAERSPVVPPKKRNVPFITDAAIACLKSLDEFVHEHREAEVVIEHGSRATIGREGGDGPLLLGSISWGFPRPFLGVPPDQSKVKLPLRELWEEWRDQRSRNCRDQDGLELVRAWVGLLDWDWRQPWQGWVKRSAASRLIGQTSSGGKQPVKPRYFDVVGGVLEWLLYLRPSDNTISYLLDIVETAFALVQPDQLRQLISLPAEQPNRYAYGDQEDVDWRLAKPFQLWTTALATFSQCSSCPPGADQWARYWRLMRWLDEPMPGARRMRPDMKVLEEAYAAGAATDADWYDQLLGPHSPGRSDLNHLTSHHEAVNRALFQRCPKVRQVVDRCRERILEIELRRGEEATAATRPALELGSLHGTDTLLRILSALGKQPFKVEASWRDDRRIGRAATLTHLAGIVYPRADDTPETFAAQFRAAVRDGQVPEERVLELAFLAPQWARHIEAYLGWSGFTEGLYWFLAHMKYVWGATERAAAGAGIDDGAADADDLATDDMAADAGDYQPKPTAWERLIRERTPLTDEERRLGAVDVAWFRKTYAELTPKRWQAMAAAARFAATPAQAKRAQFIADVLLGKVSRKELVSGIRRKKLKEYVRLLGLLPLAEGAKRDADLAERYQVLQEYRRYAKQLSAMTKEDALRSADIGLENLSRTAGYPDPLRLEWAMEADRVKDLARGPVSATRDGVTVTLSLNEAGTPQLSVKRGDKELKSIPPEIKKKDKPIAALAERVMELKRQSSRTRQSLELAMCRGDTFTGTELAQLAEHAILAPLLTRLVVVGEGIIGYPDKKGKALRNHAGKLEPVKKAETLRIAHPHDLLATGEWDAWQHECFQAERVQPFKQVFRELYVVTRQEKSNGHGSRRYAGQQVNPTQAYALWGQRGWNVRDGVWKTFYDQGITATVAFNYGLGTPLDVEGLTIETISFHRRNVLQPLKITQVPPRIFSEVMRDLDLVVSVAHRGGVDPEASASTVQMRSSLLRETCGLLQLNNVRLKEPYALVDGELGKYSVHLGSAVVHRMPGGAVCILPVHAQHRGRLFLPFADDDPKTAEVVSKVLLLARDADIQDPAILDQLRAGC
jgi:hypothetical protein